MAIFRRIRDRWRIVFLSIRSMSHNSCRTKGFYIDAAFEPLFWFVDHLAGVMGMVFVVLVTLLTSSAVVIWYLFLLPVLFTYSNIWFFFHVVIAHWLIINIAFHYYSAVFTNPGGSPQGRPMQSIEGAVICRKCIQPKPPRTHHCSVCSKCFLKMDHHCPWMNNCIGFYNHRYFILFCIYMWMGNIYVSLSTFNLFHYHFFHPGTLLDEEKRSANIFFNFGIGAILQQALQQITTDAPSLKEAIQDVKYREHPGGFTDVNNYEHIAIIYLFLLATAVACALGILNLWHISLISKGETSIEVHVNSRERCKAAKRGMGYNNQYDYGAKQNWRYLFGLYNGRSWLSVLWPSRHVPEGDGLKWPRNSKPNYYHDPEAIKKVGSFFSFRTIRRLCPC